MNMKAITIWQPWGSAIAIEAKGYETRGIKLLPEPIPAKGQQGLWNWEPPEEVLA